MDWVTVKPKEAPGTVFQRNVLALINGAKLSVNGWAVKHGFDQSTVNRIVTGGRNLKVNTAEAFGVKLASKIGLEPWQLFHPTLGAGLYRGTPDGKSVKLDPVEPPPVDYGDAAPPPQTPVEAFIAGRSGKRPPATETVVAKKAAKGRG